MNQINPRELEAFLKMKEAEAANAAISQSDGVVIRQAQGNVPGVYVSAEQKLQDNFAQQVAMQNVPGLYGQQGNPGYYGSSPLANMNTAPVAMNNPNASVAAPVTVTADASGHIVIY